MRTGNLYSTVDDLNTFLVYLDTVNHKDLMRKGRISHAGGTRGKQAYVERNFVDNYSIIFLTNYDNIPFEKLVKNLQPIMKGDSKFINRKSSNISKRRK